MAKNNELQAAITRFPSPIKKGKRQLSREDKISQISHHFAKILDLLGLDLADPSLAKTPLRIAKMYVDEVFSGLDYANFPAFSTIEEYHSTETSGSSLVLSQCSFVSFCEHHFVPMIGKAYVAYIPKKKLVGLSKLHRIVRYFASRPQLQERLTAQIADSLATLIGSPDVCCSITCQHACVIMRGVKDESAITSTSYFSGIFKRDRTMREEFFRGIQRIKKESF